MKSLCGGARRILISSLVFVFAVSLVFPIGPARAVVGLSFNYPTTGIAGDATHGQNLYWGSAFYTNSNSYGSLMKLQTNVGSTYTDRFRIDRDGNVTASGNVNAAGGLCMNGDCKANWAAVGSGQWTTSGSNIYNANAGNVGIGTTNPNTKIFIKGSHTSGYGIIFAESSDSALLGLSAANGDARVRFQKVSGTDKWLIGNDSADDSFDIANPSDTKYLTVLSGGNVGIGNTNPGAKMEINGSLIAGGQDNGEVIFYRSTNPYSAGNTDAVLTVSDRSGADWGIISDKTGFDYGMRINVAGSATYALATYNGTSYPFRVDGGGNIYSLGGASLSSSINLPMGSGLSWGPPGDYTTITAVQNGSENYDVRVTLADDQGQDERFAIFTDYWNGSASDRTTHYFSANGNAYHENNLNAGSLDIRNNATLQNSYTDTINSITGGDPLEINYRSTSPTKICATANCATFSAYFNTDGNVGINTTGPAAKLHVAGDYPLVLGSDGMLKVKSVSGGSCPGCGSETVSFQTSIDSRTDDYTISSYGGDGRHVLSLQPQGGYVGVGNTTPGYKLDVSGDVRASTYRFNANSTPYITAGATQLRFYYDAYLYNTLTFTDGSWNPQGSISGNADVVSINSNDGSGYINLQTNGGKVSIGMTVPGETLDINGSLDWTNMKWDSSENIELRGAGEFSFDFADGDGGDYWHVWDPTHGTILAVRNSGKVGIGTDSPVGTLELAGPNPSGPNLFASVVWTNVLSPADGKKWVWRVGCDGGSDTGCFGFGPISDNYGGGNFVMKSYRNSGAVTVDRTVWSSDHIFEGRVGIGVPASTYGFKLSAVDSSASSDYPAIYGKHAVTNYYGVGVRGEAKWKGIDGICTADGGTWCFGGDFTAYSGATNSVGVRASGYTYDFYAAGNGVDYGTASSKRWKKNIIPIDNALDKVMNMRGVYFDWDEEHGGTHAMGMIAEEVGKQVPEVVAYEPNGVDASGMDYGKLTPVLVNAIKEQQAQIGKQQVQIEQQQVQIEELKKEIENLKK